MLEAKHPSSVQSTAKSPFDDPKADIILLSSDNVLFYVHKFNLSLLSPVFETMFTLPDQEHKDLHDGRPCVTVGDESQRLYALLSWCDPRCIPESKTIEDMEVVMEMADKYGMDAIIKRVEAAMLSWASSCVLLDPMRAFVIAVRFRFEDLARTAARKVIRLPPAEWTRNEGMKHISALAFYNLMRYSNTCAEAAKSFKRSNLDWLDPYRGTHGSSAAFILSRCNVNCRTITRGSVEWKEWWITYLDLATDAIAKKLKGTAVEDADVLSQVHKSISASSCSNCRSYGHTHLTALSHLLSREIEKRIDEVKFELEY